MIAALERIWIDTCARRGIAPPQQVHVLKLGSSPYPHPASPHVFLLFADRSAQPVAAVKAARVAAGDATVKAEAEALAAVRSRLPADLATTVPEILRTGHINARAFLLVTALAGGVEAHHTWGARGARRAAPRIGSALAWCARIADATPADPIAATRWLGELPAVMAVLRETGLDIAAAPRLHDRLARCWTREWPAAVAHGDFFPGNVLFARGACTGVVDWAAAALRAPVFVDPLSYEMSFSLQALSDGRCIDLAEHRAVHALAPFAAARRRLAHAGVDVGLGTDAWLLNAVAGVLRETAGAAGDRLDAARRWLGLLEFEAQLAS